MVIDDKHAHLVANALIWYRDQIEDELEEVNEDHDTTEYMGGLMTREEYIRDSEAIIKEVNELLPAVNTVANSRISWDKVNRQLADQGLGRVNKGDDGKLTLSPDWKEKLKAKIDSLP